MKTINKTVVVYGEDSLVELRKSVLNKVDGLSTKWNYDYKIEVTNELVAIVIDWLADSDVHYEKDSE